MAGVYQAAYQCNYNGAKRCMQNNQKDKKKSRRKTAEGDKERGKRQTREKGLYARIRLLNVKGSTRH